ncbi:carbon-nitrogen hydrolase family protein [Robiginitomaculum antarcticum]|uniref:carbon-nitrogen hydrolase family protein n=1 Tax=Robiginitomaculum antarcticum TaxID=437507 RepID=UPI00037607CB|nr:carbon-nitrogen hydrolase family protein [Robiginitomaculum antarcticum]
MLKLALPQIAPVWLDRAATITRVIDTINEAAGEGAQLVVFGEGLVPGYPFWVDLTGGAQFNSPKQKELFAYYSDQAVSIEAGHLDGVCAALKAAGMACYLGVIERAADRSGHSLYCSYVYINAGGQIKSVHRKLQPTYEERLVWSPGDGAGLVTHKLGGFTVGGLNCWENWMPLTRAALYAQGEDLHVMCWPGSIRNTEDITPVLAKEGRSYCVSVSTIMRREDVGDTVPYATEIRAAMPDVAADGGSCIAAPDGSWVLPPVVHQTGIQYAELDPAFVRRERQNFDAAGHYSRPDVTRLIVDRRRQSLARFED